jgi:hypothetical protein
MSLVIDRGILKMNDVRLVFRDWSPNHAFGNAGCTLAQRVALFLQKSFQVFGGQKVGLEASIEGSGCKLKVEKSTGGASGTRPVWATR